MLFSSFPATHPRLVARVVNPEDGMSRSIYQFSDVPPPTVQTKIDRFLSRTSTTDAGQHVKFGDCRTCLYGNPERRLCVSFLVAELGCRHYLVAQVGNAVRVSLGCPGRHHFSVLQALTDIPGCSMISSSEPLLSCCRLGVFSLFWLGGVLVRVFPAKRFGFWFWL